MLNNRLYGAALAAALVACPAAADETATPGSFSLPGTDTRIKPYGIAYLNGWFFRDQDLGDTGALVAGDVVRVRHRRARSRAGAHALLRRLAARAHGGPRPAPGVCIWCSSPWATNTG